MVVVSFKFVLQLCRGEWRTGREGRGCMGRLLSESISHGKGSALPSLQSNTTIQEETDAWMARSMSRFQSRASLLLLSLPLCSPISLSLSLLSRSRRIHQSRINSVYSSESLKKQKKRKAWLRGRLKIKTAILFAR